MANQAYSPIGRRKLQGIVLLVAVLVSLLSLVAVRAITAPHNKTESPLAVVLCEHCGKLELRYLDWHEGVEFRCGNCNTIPGLARECLDCEAVYAHYPLDAQDATGMNAWELETVLKQARRCRHCGSENTRPLNPQQLINPHSIDR